MIKRIGAGFVLLFVLACGALVAAAQYWYYDKPLSFQDGLEFSIERGMNLRQAGERIARAGVELDVALFYRLSRLQGRGEQIIAGSYVPAPGMTVAELVEMLEKGLVARASLRLGEGWTFDQVRAAVEAQSELKADTRGLSEREIMQRIGARHEHPEGLFFPDTYTFDRHSSALALLRTAYQAMQARLQEVWQQRAADLPLASPYEALILASIIEKESGPQDPPARISAVFINRLKRGMRLQTDPTVIYGLGDQLQGRLRRVHLRTDHAYNTYTRAGLPPTPIALPSEAALLAAVQPEQSDYLYFVSKNDGSSYFSRNLAEHNRAVNRYQRGVK